MTLTVVKVSIIPFFHPVYYFVFVYCSFIRLLGILLCISFFPLHFCNYFFLLLYPPVLNFFLSFILDCTQEAKNIVDGNRDRTLFLLWQILYGFELKMVSKELEVVRFFLPTHVSCCLLFRS